MSQGLSTHSKISRVISSIGFIVSGLIAIFAPIKEVRAEVPHFFEIGVVAIVLGFLMVLRLLIVSIKSMRVVCA